MTATAYALLGLLAIQPWTTYELTWQMERSMRRFWPRAESNRYRAVQALVQHDLAEVRVEKVGRRRRRVYTITDDGRTALQEWTREPGALPVLEFETLLKVFFGEHSTKQAVLDHLQRIVDWAEETLSNGREIAASWGTPGDDPLPNRLPQVTLIFPFVWQHSAMIGDWARWAASIVDSWPEDPSLWPGDRSVFAPGLVEQANPSP